VPGIVHSFWGFQGSPRCGRGPRGIDMHDMKLMRIDRGDSLDARASRFHARHLEMGVLRVFRLAYCLKHRDRSPL
jgi:hypothetical protein